MTQYELLMAMTEGAAHDAFKAARRVPADKLEWKPLDNGRSTLNLARECAYCPLWAISSIKDVIGVPDPTEGEDYDAVSGEWTTIDACEEACNRNLKQLRAAVEAFPIERLQEPVTIHWGTFPYYRILSYPLWNFGYHEGQINYIQTLYGDQGM